MLQSTEEEYEIEKIVDFRQRKGVKYYKIKWLGYEESENSWVPEADISSNALTSKFDAEYKRKRELTKSKKADNVTAPTKTSAKPKEAVSITNAKSDKNVSKSKEEVPKKAGKNESTEKETLVSEAKQPKLSVEEENVTTVEYISTPKKSSPVHVENPPTEGSLTKKPTSSKNIRRTRKSAHLPRNKSIGKPLIPKRTSQPSKSSRKSKDLRSSENTEIESKMDVEIIDSSVAMNEWINKRLTPEKVINHERTSFGMLYLIKWVNSNQAAFVNSQVSRELCPDLVIDYLITLVNFED